jgi:hypothetical protein
MAAYQPMQNPIADLGIGEMIMKARQESKAREDRRAELFLRQQNSERDQARLDEQLRRNQATETRQQGIDVSNELPKIKAMLTPGDPSYDPQTALSMARARGINLDATAPTAPAAPVKQDVGPTQIEEGPRETPEIAQQAGLLRSLQKQPGDSDPQAGAAEDTRQIGLAEAERQRFAQANDPAAVAQNQQLASKQTGDQADYQRKLAQFSRAAPTYHGSSPIGQIDIDPNAAVAAREEALRIQRERLAPLTGAANEKFRPVVQAMIQSGMPPSEVAKFIQEQQKDLHGDAQKAEYSLTAEDQRRHNLAMERAALAAAGDRSRATASNEQNRNDATTNRNLTTYLGTVKEFENTAGIKPDVAMMKNIGKIHEELTRSPQSPVAQTAAVDTIAQIAQGGKASQGVMSQINGHALGKIESAYDQMYQLAHNGQHSPAWVKSISDTLEGLKKFAATEQGRVMTGFEAAAGDQSPFAGPEYSQMRDSQRRKIAAAMGMDVPAPRTAEPGAMRPGSGKRPDKSNPIMDARGGRKSLDDLAKEHGL